MQASLNWPDLKLPPINQPVLMSALDFENLTKENKKMIDITKVKKGDTLTVGKNPHHYTVGKKIVVESVDVNAGQIRFMQCDNCLDFLTPDCFESTESLQPEAKPGFKLGKYRIGSGVIVDIVATYEHFAWGIMPGGRMGTFNQDSLKPVAKFDHLRNLPQDTRVVVWDERGTRTHRHFLRVPDSGDEVFVFEDGKTSHTGSDCKFEAWPNCEVWKGN